MESPTGSFGESVAISGTTIVVGGPDITDTGQASAPKNLAKGRARRPCSRIPSPHPQAALGESVAVSGTDLVVGAPDQGQSLSGAVDVFTQTAKGWRQTAELKGSEILSFGAGHSPFRARRL